MRESSRTSDLIDTAVRRLTAAGVEDPRLDAEILLSEASGCSRIDIIAETLSPSPQHLSRFDEMLAMRELRIPVAYIVGHKEFYSLEFKVARDVLIPRPETETLVETALATIRERAMRSVLDIGTGSGAIAVALAVNAPDIHVTAIDISPEALDVARDNAERHNVGSRFDFRIADFFDVQDDRPPLGSFDLIASNPPYIDEAEMSSLAPEVQAESHLALCSGPDALNSYRRLAAEASRHLSEAGDLMVEVGAGQATDVANIFADAGLLLVAVIHDLAGHQRVVHARKVRP
ncbi:MAG: putative N(5)-glutamine methyltransferase PrmC [Candidatus Binatus sp.]|nr:putative N(5)-glutamine methyltransferase PrmC [Candidatus Binatus sp.]